MKKSTLILSILGTIGGLIFALGMCMWLIAEWNLFTFGVVLTVIGAIILLLMIPVYRKEHPKKDKKRKTLDGATVAAIIIGIISMILLGIGMSMTLVENSNNMVLGMIIGIIGLAGCILNFPIYQYNRTKKD